ncbi:MAG: LLM class flavin-dependent oxidoreductase [Aggregatilineales bacterium]
MKLAIATEGAFGLTWPRWKRLIGEVERLGFAGLFRADHFTWTTPPDLDSFELITSLTYLADHSQQLHFGPLVAPLSVRDPIMLARQAVALDDLSQGRLILQRLSGCLTHFGVGFRRDNGHQISSTKLTIAVGVGAGWLEREHRMFGYCLGDVKARMDRLQEGLEVITRLVRSQEPMTFEGRYYQLREAQLLPRPHRATPVRVGGSGPKRALPPGRTIC